jgi:hypothetical protein
VHIDDTVRWQNSNGQHLGWQYRSPRGRVWGLDNLGRFDRFSVEVAGRCHGVFVAPNGAKFRTIRGLFAEFRLRLAKCHRQTDPLEVMRLVLRLLEMEIHHTDRVGFVVRAYGGNRAFAEAYMHWLEAERLVTREGRAVTDVSLSTEGHAVLRMLDLTAADSGVDTTPRGAAARFDKFFPGQR